MKTKIEKQYWNDEEVFSIFASEGDASVNIGESDTEQGAADLVERFNSFEIKITGKTVFPELYFEAKTLLWNSIESKGKFKNNSCVSRDYDWTGLNAYDVAGIEAINDRIPKLSISDNRTVFYYGYDDRGCEFDTEDREAREELKCFVLSDVFHKKMYWGMIR